VVNPRWSSRPPLVTAPQRPCHDTTVQTQSSHGLLSLLRLVLSSPERTIQTRPSSKAHAVRSGRRAYLFVCFSLTFSRSSNARLASSSRGLVEYSPLPGEVNNNIECAFNAPLKHSVHRKLCRRARGRAAPPRRLGELACYPGRHHFPHRLVGRFLRLFIRFNLRSGLLNEAIRRRSRPFHGGKWSIMLASRPERCPASLRRRCCSSPTSALPVAGTAGGLPGGDRRAILHSVPHIEMRRRRALN